MSDAGSETHYGNLMSYKHYVRPAACRMYGGSSGAKTSHQENVQRILKILFLNGACTTWEIAKISLRTSDAGLIRAKEKQYRRLFLGRYDTKRRFAGLLDLGLVVREKGKNAYSRYRLSLHGVLYCMDALRPSDDETDSMAALYAGVLPKIFGRWADLKSILGDEAYKPLRILSRGLLLDSPRMVEAAVTDRKRIPLYEIMAFMHVRYSRNYESIREPDLAEQISYWFYTFLLYADPGGAHAGKTGSRAEKTKEMLDADEESHGWYAAFLRRAADHYAERLRVMRHGMRAFSGRSRQC